MTAVNPTDGSSARPLDCNSDAVREAELETAICAAYAALIAAPSWEEKLERWREMVRLIDQRSVHRVRFMERVRGL